MRRRSETDLCGAARRALLLDTDSFIISYMRCTLTLVLLTAALPADFAGWNQEARGILSDGLETLRAFDVFQAFRVSTAAQSSMRLGSELAWDPPTSAAWDEATHVARGLHGRIGSASFRPR